MIKRAAKIVIFLAAFSGAKANGEAPHLMVSAGAGHSCALDLEGVKCWGDNRAGQLKVPALKNPRQVSAGSDHTCALDDEGVKCWGAGLNGVTGYPYGNYGQTEVPPLEKPVQVSAGHYNSCALDANGVQCWGSVGELNSSFKHPRQVRAGSQPCVLDEEGVKCWRGQIVLQAPTLRNPLQTSSAEFQVCAITADGVVCWGNGYHDDCGVTQPPSMQNPSQIGVGSDFACALDGDLVRCWGKNNYGQTKTPLFMKASQMDVGATHACALDSEGVKCWGNNDTGQTNVPVLILPILESVTRTSTLARSRYIAPLVALEAASLDSAQRAEYYFVLALSSAAVLSMDSPYYVEKVQPRFRALQAFLERSLGYVNLADGLAKTPDSAFARNATLTSVKAALEEAGNFLPLESRASIREAALRVDVALRDTSNESAIKIVIGNVDGLTREKGELARSPKSAFISATLDLASDWLKGRVK